MRIKFGNYKKENKKNELNLIMLSFGFKYLKEGYSKKYNYSLITIDFLWYYIEFTFVGL